MTEPNATTFTISRVYYGDSRLPSYEVEWENSEWEDDDDDDEWGSEGDTQTRSFATLDEAIAFGRHLLGEPTKDVRYG